MMENSPSRLSGRHALAVSLPFGTLVISYVIFKSYSQLKRQLRTHAPRETAATLSARAPQVSIIPVECQQW